MPGRSSVRLAAVHKIVLVFLFLVPFCAASDHWDYEESHDQARDFVAGGMLHVRLSVGDVRITRGDSNKVRMHYTVKSRRESHVKDAHVDFEVRGSDARIDLTVANITGDKDLELGVGDIRVVVGRADYHLVRASTSIGDVNGDGYGETSGWLGKTLKYRGEGKYELRAHVGVGDITLEGK